MRRRLEPKTNDQKWQRRWASVLSYRDQTGRWPAARSTDPEVRSQAHWADFQREQHRNHRLHPEREAAMRAANFRFTAYRQKPVDDDEGSPPEETERESK